MTKADIVSEISKSTGIDKQTVLNSVESFMDIVKSSLSQGENELETSRLLRDWYRIHKRELPWRESSDPYIIWISDTSHATNGWFLIRFLSATYGSFLPLQNLQLIDY